MLLECILTPKRGHDHLHHQLEVNINTCVMKESRWSSDISQPYLNEVLGNSRWHKILIRKCSVLVSRWSYVLRFVFFLPNQCRCQGARDQFLHLLFDDLFSSISNSVESDRSTRSSIRFISLTETLKTLVLSYIYSRASILWYFSKSPIVEFSRSQVQTAHFFFKLPRCVCT